MIEWVEADDGVRAVGRAGAVTLATVGWEPTNPAIPIPYPADAALTGRLEAVRLDTGAALDGVDADDPEPVHVPDGEHLLRANDPLDTRIRFKGPATFSSSADSTELSFGTAAPISIGVRDASPEPRTLSVPRTPAGLAGAVTVAGNDLPDGPERSFAPNRPHPPLVEYDVGDPPSTGERPIRFTVPDDLEHVLVAAPLAYYLGAELRVADAEPPRLTIPETGFEYAFGRLQAFSTQVADALQRVVHLDRCARAEAPPSTAGDTLGSLGLDADALCSVGSAVRYATFLDAEVDVPDWHLSTYVDADYDRARTLPSLLDRLSLVYPAEATEMSPRDLLESSLDDFYRGAVSVTPLAPELGFGDAHAWLADGEVVDAFKTTPRAYENARERTPSGESLSVAVVLNDPEMDAELAVADAYRKRGGALPLSVTVHESLPVADLAAVFETDTDFLHYVGHCEADGLRCPDGYLSATSLSRSGARAFFLNACGSYYEGETLVERGSVAGAVTLEKVLNEQAARVGTAFGRLVVAGYSIDRALSLARRRIMMGKDYAAIGDGTARVAPPIREPAVVTVENATDSGYDVRYDAAPGVGSTYRDPFSGSVRPRGEPSHATLSRENLLAFLDGRELPVLFDGDIQLSGDFGTELLRPRGEPLHW